MDKIPAAQNSDRKEIILKLEQQLACKIRIKLDQGLQLRNIQILTFVTKLADAMGKKDEIFPLGTPKMDFIAKFLSKHPEIANEIAIVNARKYENVSTVANMGIADNPNLNDGNKMDFEDHEELNTNTIKSLSYCNAPQSENVSKLNVNESENKETLAKVDQDDAPAEFEVFYIQPNISQDTETPAPNSNPHAEQKLYGVQVKACSVRVDKREVEDYVNPVLVANLRGQRAASQIAKSRIACGNKFTTVALQRRIKVRKIGRPRKQACVSPPDVAGTSASTEEAFDFQVKEEPVDAEIENHVSDDQCQQVSVSEKVQEPSDSENLDGEAQPSYSENLGGKAEPSDSENLGGEVEPSYSENLGGEADEPSDSENFGGELESETNLCIFDDSFTARILPEIDFEKRVDISESEKRKILSWKYRTRFKIVNFIQLYAPKAVPCLYCRSVFIDVQTLYRHICSNHNIMTKHTTCPSSTCRFCEESFATRIFLELHIYKRHDTLKLPALKSEFCSKQRSTKGLPKFVNSRPSSHFTINNSTKPVSDSSTCRIENDETTDTLQHGNELSTFFQLNKRAKLINAPIYDVPKSRHSDNNPSLTSFVEYSLDSRVSSQLNSDSCPSSSADSKQNLNSELADGPLVRFTDGSESQTRAIISFSWNKQSTSVDSTEMSLLNNVAGFNQELATSHSRKPELPVAMQDGISESHDSRASDNTESALKKPLIKVRDLSNLIKSSTEQNNELQQEKIKFETDKIVSGLSDSVEKSNPSFYEPADFASSSATEKLNKEPNTEPLPFDIFPCSNCKLTFENANALIEHINECKKNVICALPCRKCSNKFISITKLEAHMKHVHNCKDMFKIKIYSCQNCNYKFLNPSELSMHTDTTRTYCEFCKETFDTRCECFQHVRLVHNEAQTKVFTCSYCGLPFVSKHFLRKHMQIIHNIYSCYLCKNKFRIVVNVRIDENSRVVCSSCRTPDRASPSGIVISNVKSLHQENTSGNDAYEGSSGVLQPTESVESKCNIISQFGALTNNSDTVSEPNKEDSNVDGDLNNEIGVRIKVEPQDVS